MDRAKSVPRPWFSAACLASVIVCLRWIQETPTIIDIRNRDLAEEARDFGDSTPAIAKLSPAAGAWSGQGGLRPAAAALPRHAGFGRFLLPKMASGGARLSPVSPPTTAFRARRSRLVPQPERAVMDRSIPPITLPLHNCRSEMRPTEEGMRTARRRARVIDFDEHVPAEQRPLYGRLHARMTAPARHRATTSRTDSDWGNSGLRR
jgi:hypothetical protein